MSSGDTSRDELWKPVRDWPEYEVSSQGRVRRVTPAIGTYPGRILKPHLDRGGYLQVKLYREKNGVMKLVHRLVLQAFLGRMIDGLQTNHLNGNKQDNRARNLGAVTQHQNMAHAIALGLRAGVAKRGEENNLAKLSRRDVWDIRRMRREGMLLREIATEFDVSVGHVGSITTGRCWKWLPQQEEEIGDNEPDPADQ